MIACKGKKCLKYPICKSLTLIDCDIIDQYYKVNKYERDKVFITLNNILPNLTSFKTKMKCVSGYRKYYIFSVVTK